MVARAAPRRRRAAAPGADGAARSAGLAGLVAGLAGGLLLATNMLQVWQTRFPTTEVLAQALYLGALLGVVVALQTGWRPAAGLSPGCCVGVGWLNRADGVLLVVMAVGVGALLLARPPLGRPRLVGRRRARRRAAARAAAGLRPRRQLHARQQRPDAAQLTVASSACSSSARVLGALRLLARRPAAAARAARAAAAGAGRRSACWSSLGAARPAGARLPAAAAVRPGLLRLQRPRRSAPTTSRSCARLIVVPHAARLRAHGGSGSPSSRCAGGARPCGRSSCRPSCCSRSTPTRPATPPGCCGGRAATCRRSCPACCCSSRSPSPSRVVWRFRGRAVLRAARRCSPSSRCVGVFLSQSLPLRSHDEWKGSVAVAERLSGAVAGRARALPVGAEPGLLHRPDPAVRDARLAGRGRAVGAAAGRPGASRAA